MNSFKLIGIRPHEKCHSKFLKVLEPGRMYQFYNEYEFYTKYEKFDGINGEITGFDFKPTVPDDLFRVGNLNVNISAVVGKNGTGKSTLIELLLYCVYYLGTNLENENNEKVLYQYKDHIYHMINANDIKKTDYKKKKTAVENYVENCLLNPEEITKIGRKKLKENFIKKQNELLDIGNSLLELEKNQRILKKKLNKAKVEHDSIINSLKCSLFFEINQVVYEIKIDNKINFMPVDNHKKIEANQDKQKEIKRDIIVISLFTPKSTELLNYFLYSIVLNYSHHSLNARHLGYWINTLFHKNDGYKTPAVINPMRDNGNFDINDENKLAKTRLLINSLVDCLVNNNKNPFITDKQVIQKVRFTFNSNKFIGNDITVGNPMSDDPKDQFIIAGKNVNNLNLLQKIYALTFEEDNVLIYNKLLPFNEKIHNYISEKSLKIQDQYPEYKVKWKEDDNVFTSTDRYATDLVNDKSHITYKLKQALYFLDKSAKEGADGKWNGRIKYFDFDLEELLAWMGITKVEELENVFTRIPPAIFNIDFLLVEINQKKKKPSSFEDLSSGEQQKIHTLNTIIYHLNNLYSVHLSKSEVSRIKYSSVNIILDEIELYYHPDLQRRFVFDLIETIKVHEHLIKAEFIKGLNFIFSTHSPFILSDIPEQNILQLAYNYSEFGNKTEKYSIPINLERQTFGANIHDLLSNSFFLENSYKGEFARNYFRNLIEKINGIKITQDTNIEEYKIWKTKVDLIAEPFIKSKIFEKLDNKFESIINPFDEKIRRMNDVIEKLKKERKNNQLNKEDDTDKR